MISPPILRYDLLVHQQEHELSLRRSRAESPTQQIAQSERSPAPSFRARCVHFIEPPPAPRLTLAGRPSSSRGPWATGRGIPTQFPRRAHSPASARLRACRRRTCPRATPGRRSWSESAGNRDRPHATSGLRIRPATPPNKHRGASGFGVEPEDLRLPGGGERPLPPGPSALRAPAPEASCSRRGLRARPHPPRLLAPSSHPHPPRAAGRLRPESQGGPSARQRPIAAPRAQCAPSVRPKVPSKGARRSGFSFLSRAVPARTAPLPSPAPSQSWSCRPPSAVSTPQHSAL
jgi:hypothetical protein